MNNKRLLTKCCAAEAKIDKHPYDPYAHQYCSHCKKAEPKVEWVEMCEGCKRPAKYCDCP